MRETGPENPTPILDSLGQSFDEALMTVAAFMLAAGARRESRVADPDFLPEEDLRSLGLIEWWYFEEGKFKPDEAIDILDFDEFGQADPDKYYSRLADVVYTAISKPNLRNTARAVKFGLHCPDDLVRVCALTSSIELLRFNPIDVIQRLTWFMGRELDTTTADLVARLFSRATSIMPQMPPTPPASAASSAAVTTGLMLIHGTNPPQSRPTWSVPVTGPLFNHIQPQRPDLYGKSDYYRWEGGYSDYAREVAAYNLEDWIARRNANGIDAITHSHGGNVLMEATTLGVAFNKVIFLSCPVRWWRYQPHPNSIAVAQSIRLRFDFVILGDRACQRFPNGSNVVEEILPIWFVDHSTTTEPKTWTKRKLDRFL